MTVSKYIAIHYFYISITGIFNGIYFNESRFRNWYASLVVEIERKSYVFECDEASTGDIQHKNCNFLIANINSLGMPCV